MSILNWFFGKPPFHRFEDTFALTRESLWPAIHKAVLNCLSDNSLVVLVTHFPSTFERLQRCIGDWDLDYQIADRPLDQNWFAKLTQEDFQEVHLVLADFLPSVQTGKTSDFPGKHMSVIVCERHPQIIHEQKIESFARTSPLPSRVGYFLALNDQVVRRTVEPGVIDVLLHLGLNEHELIASRMVTRRIDKLLKRQSSKIGTDYRADSPEEWYELNDSTSESN